ncbi:MAG: AAA family ATPase [Chloroflexi bacterium]|nr:AAA family ATPase [Chloroflexota bacterium]
MGIRRLTIERYRGVEKFEWYPSPGVNALIGPGDAGKTTVLSAISLLLSAKPSSYASEYDYFQRNTQNEFEIAAVIGDLSQTLRRAHPSAQRGWKDNQFQGLPDEDGAEAVILASVKGNKDLEISDRLIRSDDAEEPFPPSSRRALNLVNIASGARAMTELRLSRGSLLDRHIKGGDLRSVVSEKIAAASVDIDLPAEIAISLEELRQRFKAQGLPSDLHLGLITPQERSLLWLVGLLNGVKPEQAVPMAFSGSGTTQLAMFALASALAQGDPILVVDELEAGLEPYRQRAFLRSLAKLSGATGQAFVTTHSPAVLSVLTGKQVARMMPGTNPRTLDDAHIDKLLRQAPAAFVSRLPILCEGETEAGLLSEVLEHYATQEGMGGLDVLGIEVVAREGITLGQPLVLQEAKALLDAGFACGLFVDNETFHKGARAELCQRDRCAFGCWETVVNIEQAVATWLPVEKLSKLVDLAASLQPERKLEAFLQQVGDRAGKPGKGSISALIETLSEKAVRDAVSRAMQGEGRWFKQMGRARALGRFLLDEGVPPEIEEVFQAFWQSIKKVLNGTTGEPAEAAVASPEGAH